MLSAYCASQSSNFMWLPRMTIWSLHDRRGKAVPASSFGNQMMHQTAMRLNMEDEAAYSLCRHMLAGTLSLLRTCSALAIRMALGQMPSCSIPWLSWR